MVSSKYLLAASLLVQLSVGQNGSTPISPETPDIWLQPGYSDLDQHGSLMWAHVGFMIAAWFFILPIGVMLSIARSRWTVPIQLVFLGLNGGGLVFGILYNANTPDLYPNNSHHKIGWIASWTVTAQVAMGLLFMFSERTALAEPAERVAFLPEHDQFENRWSGDSGQGTERDSTSLHSRDVSPDEAGRREPKLYEIGTKSFDLRNAFVFKLLRRHMPELFSRRALKALTLIYDGMNRITLPLGFVALTTGVVTYAGIFRDNNVFNGLAHFIKGGIFFRYGILTLGRWAGCFADIGWAWNVRPEEIEVGSWKASVPSAEFTESFVIWLYGISNVFLEHLAAWGDDWTTQDLEHVSISVMFFGGGLCGMLVESPRIRSWLNTSILLLPGRDDSSRRPQTHHSMNPIPALIVLLLGIMMSSHHQDSIVSSAVHKQWGMLLIGCSLSRFLTYILFFITSPTSTLPSRPPTELLASFCLISGGLIFMASSKDIIRVMEEHDVMAMFVFTVSVGFTVFLMCWEIFALAVKGWATRRASPGATRLAAIGYST